MVASLDYLIPKAPIQGPMSQSLIQVVKLVPHSIVAPKNPQSLLMESR